MPAAQHTSPTVLNRPPSPEQVARAAGQTTGFSASLGTVGHTVANSPFRSTTVANLRRSLWNSVGHVLPPHPSPFKHLKLVLNWESEHRFAPGRLMVIFIVRAASEEISIKLVTLTLKQGKIAPFFAN
ncbi:hypothetical protein RRG08_006851 [Elysia crispata]|uniref:Uncharacterized protein n=1 Tax=Elysia crispata TaxID=231223 RepID=A0AAE1D7H9_9GAST|nr:hypothetical protein RRG08_006851 [Elysia crispata]